MAIFNEDTIVKIPATKDCWVYKNLIILFIFAIKNFGRKFLYYVKYGMIILDYILRGGL